MHNVRIKDYGQGKKQYTLYYNVINGFDFSNKKNIDDDVGGCYSPTENEEKEIEKEKNRLNSELNNYKRAKNKIYDYARCNMWDYFLTFTFNPDKVDRTNYDECRKKLTKWLNNISQRYCNGELKYIIVPELHSDGVSYHFHGLLSNCDGIIFVPSGHIDNNGRTIYNLPQYKLGFTTATAITDTNKVCSYLAKYVTKQLDLKLKGKRRYLASTNLNLPTEEKLYTNKNLDTYANDIPFVQWAELKEYYVCGEKRKMMILEVDENIETSI